jgi:hypothetical protein
MIRWLAAIIIVGALSFAIGRWVFPNTEGLIYYKHCEAMVHDVTVKWGECRVKIQEM